MVVVVIGSLLSGATAQTYGYGIGKSTWSAPDPVKCYDFWTKYFPVVDSTGNCDDHQCKVKGQVCNTQARVNLNDVKDFGIHAVNCTCHPSGKYSLSQVDNKFSAGLGDFTEFNPLMDYNTGLWTNDLDSFAAALQKGGVKFLALKWNGTSTSDSTTYYSIIVNACAWTNFEIMGDSLSVVAAVEYPTARLDWSNTPDKHDSPEWTALKVSRATANITAVKEYYKAVGAQFILEKTYDTGLKRLELVMADSANIHLQFWEHPDSHLRSGLEASAWSVGDFESYINSVHEDTMSSDVCGFSQWMDNHVAYNVRKPYDTRDLADIADTIKAAGYKVHWWTSKGSGYVVYSPDPTGWVVGYYGDSTSPPANTQLYGANCASAADGCLGQGYCNKAV